MSIITRCLAASPRHEVQAAWQTSTSWHELPCRCYGGNQNPPCIFIVEELMECSLCDLLHPRAGRSRAVPLRRLLGIAADVAAGLAHLHPTIVHRDLK